jgi:hypothetical protein
VFARGGWRWHSAKLLFPTALGGGAFSSEAVDRGGLRKSRWREKQDLE